MASLSRLARSVSATTLAGFLANTLACTPPEPSVGPACGNSTFTREIEVGWPDAVDLVLVVDNTEGMERAQQTLIETLPGVLHQLLSGDRDGDGIAEAPSVRSIHLGVITTDMGTGVDHLNSFDGCRTPSGDDGLIGASIRASVAPSFLSFSPSDVRAELRAETARAIDVTTRGCIFRQPLEAALKAITPADARDLYWDDPISRFRDPTTGGRDAPGHASTGHAGFFRRDAILSVILMTNGDDCSTRDESIYMDTPEMNARWGSDPRLRCTRGVSTMHPIDRYARGVGGARYFSDWPPPAILGAIVGIPEAWASTAASVPRHDDLSDERMQIVETGDIANPLRDACVSQDGATHADPPRRILELNQALPRPMSLASICSDDFTPAFRDLLDITWGYVGTGCLPRALPRDAHGLVPSPRHCRPFAMRTASRTARTYPVARSWDASPCGAKSASNAA